MPRIARTVSPVRVDAGRPPPSPPRTRGSVKRTASQALPPTPPRTVKRDRKTRSRSRTCSRASSAKPKSKSPTRTRSRAPGLETILEESDEAEEEVSLGVAVGRRLNFGPVSKRRKLEELDARLETLLESLDGADPENPFWDGPTKGKPPGVSDKAQKSDTGMEKGVKAESVKEKGSEKIVRIRSPSPALLSFRGKAPVSPPPSNRRKKKVRGKAAAVAETIVEENIQTQIEPEAEASLKQVLEETGESSTSRAVEQPSDSKGQSLDEERAEPQVSRLSEGPSAKAELGTERLEDPIADPKDDLPLIDLPPMPSTPKKGKGKKRMDSPIRDTPNNPFLDDSPASITGEPEEPRTPTLRAEQPTVTYVFRGKRAEFANPLYNLPPDVHERSLLPVEHPDYSPDPACPPRRLFPKSRGRNASSSPTRRGRSGPETRSMGRAPSAGPANGWDDSDDEADLHFTPPRRLFH